MKSKTQTRKVDIQILLSANIIMGRGTVPPTYQIKTSIIQNY